MFFDRTGLPWVNPSPNIRNPTAALIYPGLGLLEFTNLSVGRGTKLPFELVGAPYIDPEKLAAEIHAAAVPGVAVVPVRFTPEASRFRGEQCGGLRILVKDRRKFRAVDFGVVLAQTLHVVRVAVFARNKRDTSGTHREGSTRLPLPKTG